VDALVEGVLALAADPQRRKAMGEAGAEFVEREFSRRTWACRYLDVLDGVPRMAIPDAIRNSTEAVHLS
jgi:glycosyltransferase involved in cell wall biosynthesis